MNDGIHCTCSGLSHNQNAAWQWKISWLSREGWIMIRRQTLLWYFKPVSVYIFLHSSEYNYVWAVERLYKTTSLPAHLQLTWAEKNWNLGSLLSLNLEKTLYSKCFYGFWRIKLLIIKRMQLFTDPNDKTFIIFICICWFYSYFSYSIVTFPPNINVHQ